MLGRNECNANWHYIEKGEAYSSHEDRDQGIDADAAFFGASDGRLERGRSRPGLVASSRA